MAEAITDEHLYDILLQIQDDVRYIRSRVDDQHERLLDLRYALIAMRDDDA